jgi:hypothetical protein
MLMIILILMVMPLDVRSGLFSGRTYMEFDGHVLCRLGNADVPVKNAEVMLMEEDRWFFTYNSTIRCLYVTDNIAGIF